MRWPEPNADRADLGRAAAAALAAALTFLCASGLVAGWTLALSPPVWLAALAGGVVAGTASAIGAHASARRRIEEVEVLLDQMSRGDLSQPLVRAAGSTAARKARATATYVRRNLLRAGRVVHDLTSSAEHLRSRIRHLAEATEEQKRSTTQTTRAMGAVDEHLQNMEQGVEGLSDFAEHTSASLTELTASIEEVASSSRALAGLVEETVSSVAGITDSVRSVASHAESLAASAAENAAAMEEMDAAIAEVDGNATTTAQLAAKVASASDDGQRTVDDVVEGLDSIRDAVARAGAAVERLAQRSDEIGAILRTIKEVSDQTNLLALNAAIIAAQAGERGRGFGVVADEIRDLAERTAASVNEIGGLISSVQREVSGVTEAVDAGGLKAEAGLALGRRAAESLRTIAELTQQSDQAVQFIARATAEQRRGTSQVSSATQAMSRKVEEIAAATAEQRLSAERLAEHAEHMHQTTELVKRATGEQSQSARDISEGMEKVVRAVETIHHGSHEITRASRGVVDSMKVIDASTLRHAASVRGLGATVLTLGHEARLLGDSVAAFRLPEPTRGGDVRTAARAGHEVDLDPARAINLRMAELTGNLFNGLVTYGEGATVLPDLAEAWDTSPDGRTYRFRLREGLRFHNGRPLSARDVVFSWQRHLEPGSDLDGGWVFDAVEGVDDFREARADRVAGFTIVDERTLEIRLQRARAHFLSTLTLPECYVLPESECRAAGTAFFRHPIGTGPFRLAEWGGGTRLRFERNESYHIAGVPSVASLEHALDAEDGAELVRRLRSGEIHYAVDLPAQEVAALLDDPEWCACVQSGPQLHTGFVSLRCTEGPLSDVRVRRALNYAVDKERFVREVKLGLATAVQGLLPPGLADGSAEGPVYPFDPDRARALLAEAGYPSGLTLGTFARETAEGRIQDELSFVFDAWARIGVRVEVERVPSGEFRQRHKRLAPPIYPTGWYADFPDSDNFFQLFQACGDALHIGWRSEEMERLLDRARQIDDPAEREGFYRRAERFVIDGAPVVWLYHERAFVVQRPELEGIRLYFTPPVVRPKDLWLEPGEPGEVSAKAARGPEARGPHDPRPAPRSDP